MLADLILSANYLNITIDINQRPSNMNFFNYTFEYCGSYGNLSPIIRLGIEGLRNVTKDLFQACPYKPRKRIGVENIPMALGLPFITLMNIPRGDYRTIFSIQDQQNEIIFSVQLLGTVSQRRGQRNG